MYISIYSKQGYLSMNYELLCRKETWEKSESEQVNKLSNLFAPCTTFFLFTARFLSLSCQSY